MFSVVKSETNWQFCRYKVGIFPDHSKVTERNTLLILKTARAYICTFDRYKAFGQRLVSMSGKVGKTAYRIFVIHF